MDIDMNLTDDGVLAELGSRVAGRRVVMGLTQAQLAKQAGVAKRTLERLEAGESSQLVTLIRVLRSLDAMAGVEQLLSAPEQSPMALLKERGKRGASSGRRQRASSKKSGVQEHPPWTWGDDA
jgi:transcriptional regulator with XRE-family HTH domain